MTFAQIFAQFAVNANCRKSEPARILNVFKMLSRFQNTHWFHLFLWKVVLLQITWKSGSVWCPVFYNTGKCLKICSNVKCFVLYSSLYRLPLAKHQCQNGPKLLKWTLFKQQRWGNITLVSITEQHHTQRKSIWGFQAEHNTDQHCLLLAPWLGKLIAIKGTSN